jgi:hypothetical protein
MHQQRQHRSQLNEDLRYQDLAGMLTNQISIDEFASKMGEDDDIVVVSFFVKEKQAADDLVNWFETGYDFVLDADRSPGQVRNNRFLVFVELERRSTTGQKIQDLLDDLNTLCEIEPDQWVAKHEDNEWEFTPENYRSHVAQSPLEYRERKEKDLNRVREAAGLDTVPLYDRDSDIEKIQQQAGIL